ncbi:MAG: choline dehydrogenase [Burkholderiales bacterium]|nr:choline dehydrogenase [Burkholderiales bacterium]
METTHFDYVIVGAGSAGCVLADSLSAQAGLRVLLVEAGPPDRNPWIHVPGGIFKLINNPAVDWCYQTEPEPGLNGRRMGLPSGRVLGGSSSINGMIYVRGQRRDYDGWRELGNRGWSYDELLPYFRRSEDQGRGADAFHGAGGPLAVSDPRFRFPVVDAFVAAAQEAGLPRNPDFNGAAQEGVGLYQLTVRDGRRSSAANAFLKPARGRPNLRVVTGAVVQRIVFEGARAVGVEFTRGGQRELARAGAEVIVSAGAIGSPKLLLLSGIGAPDDLRALALPVVRALPGVGRNFQDHYQARLVFKTKRPITLNDHARSAWQRMLIGADYALRRRGALTFGASLAGAFARTESSLASPDVQFHFQPLSVDSYDTGLNRFSAFTISVCQLRPASRGAVTLRSADPNDSARIVGNYLTAAEDGAALVRGIRLLERIVAQPALASEVASRWKPRHELGSDSDALAYARDTGMTIFHPSGTCRMGGLDDAVVDDQLAVHGVAGLRVVDASIMPTLVSGNTNAATIMIAEKAADMILAARKSGSAAAPAPAARMPVAA